VRDRVKGSTLRPTYPKTTLLSELTLNKNLTDITAIVDRSGSMGTIRVEAQGGLNAFIQEHKDAPGEAMLTLVQFDEKYDVVHDAVNIQDVPKFTLSPRGMTALNDAIGKTINTVGERLAAMPEADRPGLVLFLIVTDGGENSSREFRDTWKVKEMITRQQAEYSWKFVFLGAEGLAENQAADFGIPKSQAAAYAATSAGTSAAYASVTRSTTQGRLAAGRGAKVDLSFSEADRKSMTQEDLSGD